MIFSPRQKLQMLRKEHKISQLELVKEKISRSHLAMIETGKTKLSRKIAMILVDNFNDILIERGVEDRIDLEFILEDEKTQIDKKRAYYLEDLKKGMLTDELITDIEEFIKVADLKSKVLLYTKIADFYYAAGHFRKANTYYQRSFDDLLVYEDIELVANSILKLLTVKLHFKDYTFNVACGRLLKDRLIDFPKGKQLEVIKLLIKSSMEVGYYNFALNYLELLEKETKDKEDLFVIETDKGSCYEGLGQFSSAVSIYRGMLLKYNQSEKKLLVSIRLMNTYKLQEDFKKVEAYFKKNFALLKKLDISLFEKLEISKISYHMAQSAYYLKKEDKALDFYMRVINTFCESNCTYQLLAMEMILKLADKTDLEFIKKMEEIYFKTLTQSKSYKLGYLYLEFYQKNRFENERNRFLDKQLNYL